MSQKGIRSSTWGADTRVTDRMARRVGDTGTVYAVDASADQLQIARVPLTHHRDVNFIDGVLEADPLRGQRVDWVYRRSLLMHVRDRRRAHAAMADMLTNDGAVLLENADIGTARFSPADPDSELSRPWWYALGQARRLSLDVAGTTDDPLDAAGFAIIAATSTDPLPRAEKPNSSTRSGSNNAHRHTSPKSMLRLHTSTHTADI